MYYKVKIVRGSTVLWDSQWNTLNGALQWIASVLEDHCYATVYYHGGGVPREVAYIRS